MNQHFAICINNEEYPASLERRKLYEVVPDADAESLGQLRVKDESGEAYLYPKELFVSVDLTSGTEMRLSPLHNKSLKFAPALAGLCRTQLKPRRLA